MTLFVLRKLILQTHMRSHPLELDVWFLVGPFFYFHTSCVRTAKALARLRGRLWRDCAGSPEPSLVACVVSSIILWAYKYILWTIWNLGWGFGFRKDVIPHWPLTPAFRVVQTLWFICVWSCDLRYRFIDFTCTIVGLIIQYTSYM